MNEILGTEELARDRARFLMSTLTADDPVMRCLRRIVVGFNFAESLLEITFDYLSVVTVAEGVRTPRIHKSELAGWSDALYTLRHFDVKCNYEASHTKLAYLVDHFHIFAELFELVLSTVERMVAILKREVMPAKNFEHKLLKVKNDFSLLKELVDQVTPVHIALQDHLSYLVLASDTSTDVERLKSKSLFTLRDEYFIKPEPGVLAKYLVASETYTINKFYSARARAFINNETAIARFKAEMDSRAANLEVFSLMEAVVS